VPFKKFFKARDPMGAVEWEKVEEASGLKLEQESRDRIHLFMKLYSSVGPLYSDTQSVLAKTAEKEIKSWLAATGRLWRALSPADTDLAELMPDVKNGVFPQEGSTPSATRPSSGSPQVSVTFIAAESSHTAIDTSTTRTGAHWRPLVSKVE